MSVRCGFRHTNYSEYSKYKEINMKKKLLALTFVLTLLVSILVCVGIGASAASTAALPAASDGQQIEVWLVAGQSNAFGDAEVENYPTDEAYADYKTLLTNGADDVYHLYNTSTEFVPAAFGQGSQTHSGPEIGITTALSGKGKQNAIIKLAYGNTSLYNGTTSDAAIKYGTWTPPSYIEKHSINTNGNKTGDLYLSFLLKVEEGLDMLVDAGYTPVIKGLWWMQGEADTFGAASSAAYAELLETLISDMRADLSEISGTSCYEMPFVYGRVLANSGYDIPTYITAVQAAQDEVAAKNLKNVFMIDTTKDLVDPVTKAQRTPVQQDRWHYDSLSQQMIGEAFVRCVQGIDEVQTKYGYVPADHADESAFPFAVFKDGECIGAYATWKETLTAAVNPILGVDTTNETVQILLRRDYTMPNNADTTTKLHKTAGNVVLDLGGNSFTAKSYVFELPINTTNPSVAGSAIAMSSSITVKNGELLCAVSKYPIIITTLGTDEGLTDKVYNVALESVNFGYASGATITTPLFKINGKDVKSGTVNFDFDNCNFDFTTNAPSGKTCTWFNFNDTYDSVNVHATVKGGSFYANDLSNVIFSSLNDGSDSLTFVKDADGNYTSFTMPITADEETLTAVGFSTPEGEITYRKVETNESNSTFELLKLDTEYGTISDEYASPLDYPFAVFKDGKCIGGYSTWASALNAAVNQIAGTGTGKETVQILLRKDFIQGTGDATTVLHKTAGSVVLDLGGNTFMGKTYVLDLPLQTTDGKIGGPMVESSSILVKNGTFLNAYQIPMMGSSYGLDTTRLIKKTYNVTFENVNFGYASGVTTMKLGSPLYTVNSNKGDVKSGTVNFTFDNCHFDFTTNAPSGTTCTWFKFQDTYDSVNVHATVKGGSFYASELTYVNISSLNDGNDSVTFVKDADGNYTSFSMPITADEKVLAAVGFNTPEGEMKYGKVETNKGNSTFALVKLGTEYGTISDQYASPLDYPFAIFKDDECIGACSTWASAITAAVNPIVGADTAGETVQILLRRDYTQKTSGDYANPLYTTAGNVVLDLGGNTFTVKNYFLDLTFHTIDKATEGPIAVSSSVVVKNGEILVGSSKSIIASAYANNTRLTAKTYNLTFEGVDFGYASGATTTTPLYVINHNNRNVKSGTVNLTFDNCNFDLTTNAPAGKTCTWFTFKDTYNSIDIHATIKGGSLYASDLTYVKFDNLNPGSDSVTYVKDENGYYTTLEVPSGTALPDLTINGGELKFVKVDSNSSTDTYRLRETAIADISFVPKASITLGSELVYNIYVPVADFLISFTVDGVSYEDLVPVTLDDGNSYYRIEVPMAASEAARVIKLVATISVGESTATGTFTFSIPKYAEKVIASGAEVEVQLVKDVLSYIRAAYAYFGTTDAEAMAKIDELLGENYDESSAPVMNGSAEKPTLGITAVTYNLTATPAIRFYLADGYTASMFSFSICGEAVTAVEGNDSTGAYLEISLYAYKMCETIDYVVGEDKDSCHIKCYYEWSKTKNNDALVKLVLRFAKYCESAAAYRESVVGN